MVVLQHAKVMMILMRIDDDYEDQNNKQYINNRSAYVLNRSAYVLNRSAYVPLYLVIQSARMQRQGSPTTTTTAMMMMVRVAAYTNALRMVLNEWSGRCDCV